MDFQDRIQRAIQRGERTRTAKQREAADRALSVEECRRLHTDFRLKLSEYIEQCLAQLADNFPGFQCEEVMSDRGWGASCTRDDVGRGSSGKRDNFFSRLEMVVRPMTSTPVLELAAKGTIRNKEIYNRQHYQRLEDVDLESFTELVDLWVLEYAELYAAKG